MHTECYNTTIPAYSYMPQDIEHNCELWQYDHQKNAHISNVAMRKFINYALTGVIMFYTYQYLQSDVFAGHNVDSFLYAGLATMPMVLIPNNIPIGVVDSIYYTTGFDLIASFTEDVNNFIDVLLYVPNIFKKFVTKSVHTLKNTSTKNEVGDTHNISPAEEQAFCPMQGEVSFTNYSFI